MEQQQRLVILVPVDGSTAGLEAVRTAVRAMLRRRAQLHLVTVGHAGAPPDAILEEARGTAVSLGAPAEDVHVHQTDAEKDGAQGAAQAIAAMATTVHADLVVMASHGHGGTLRGVMSALGLGGTAYNCLQLLNCPLCIIRAPRGGLRLRRSASTEVLHQAELNRRTRTIAVAMDSSAEAQAACEWAMRRLAVGGDELHLLYVRHTQDGEGTEVEQIAMRQASERAMSAEAQHEGRVKAIAVVLPAFRAPFGVGTAIVDYTNHNKVDVLVVGYRGENGFKRLGSVSEYCANHCTCPVIIHKQPAPSPDVH